MSIDVEYAIKQDIRNNPVVREVDLEQKREFYRTIGLVALFVAMLLFAARQQFTIVNHGYQVETLRLQLAAEESLQRKLRLQLEMQRSPEAIAQKAARDLQMVAPTWKDTMVLERVPAAVPSSAVVAAVRRETGAGR